jgi:hypothetical protein
MYCIKQVVNFLIPHFNFLIIYFKCATSPSGDITEKTASNISTEPTVLTVGENEWQIAHFAP